MQNFPNRVQQLRSVNVASSRIQSPDSGSMTFPTAPGSSLAPSKGPSIRLTPELQGEGGEACWLRWPGLITPLIVLGVSSSVFPHQWLDEWPWANRLFPLSPIFSSTEQSLMWRSKDIMAGKAVEKNQRESYFSVSCLDSSLWCTAGLYNTWVTQALGPLPAILAEKIMVRSLGLESNDKTPNPDSFFLEVCFPHDALSHYTPIPLSGNRNNSHKPRVLHI